MLKVNWTVKENRFPIQPSKLKRALNPIIAASGRRVLADAQRRSPVDTGLNRASGRLNISGIGYTVGFDTPYSLYLERGTRKMAARPYLEPAMTAESPVLEASLRAIGGALG